MTPQAQFGLSSIGQIAIVVRDLGRAVRFYKETLGMQFLFEAPPSLAFFDCGGIRLMLSPPEGTSDALSSVIYYRVGDIQAAAETLKSRGVSFEEEPHLVAKMPDHELWMAFFRDPDRNLLALMCEVKR